MANGHSPAALTMEVGSQLHAHALTAAASTGPCFGTLCSALAGPAQIASPGLPALLLSVHPAAGCGSKLPCKPSPACVCQAVRKAGVKGQELPPFSALCVTVPGAAGLWEDAVKSLGRLPLSQVRRGSYVPEQSLSQPLDHGKPHVRPWPPVQRSGKAAPSQRLPA